MLKHVQTVPRCRSSLARSPHKSDTLSINSTMSFGSLAEPALSSRSSSYTSLNETQSSTGSASLPAPAPSTTIKVYTRSLRPDLEYKTMPVKYNTSCRDLVDQLLNKYRMKHRDPNLFFLTMEVATKGTDTSVRTILVLDDSSCPAQLQACYPRVDSRFTIRMRRGGFVKIHDSVLMAESKYKSLLVSERTTVDQVVRLLLNCYKSEENPSLFNIYEVCRHLGYERRLRADDHPLVIQQEWPTPGTALDGYQFVLMRRAPVTARLGCNLPLRRSFLHWSRDRELSTLARDTSSTSTELEKPERRRSRSLSRRSLTQTFSLPTSVEQQSAASSVTSSLSIAPRADYDNLMFI